MQIILIKPMRKLGKVGEIVNVPNGYGRNYLLPRKIALRATTKNLEEIASIRSDLESKNLKEKEECQKIAERIRGKSLNFIVQSASDGRLFGSVTAKAIASHVSDIAGYKLSYSNIILDAPIKFNGAYDVQIMLHPDVVIEVLIIVARSESEAKDYLLKYTEDKKSSQEDLKKEHELDLIESDSSSNQTDDNSY